MLPKVLQTQPDSFSLAILKEGQRQVTSRSRQTCHCTHLTVPLQSGAHGLVRVVTAEREIPDGEVEAWTPCLDGHDLE